MRLLGLALGLVLVCVTAAAAQTVPPPAPAAKDTSRPEILPEVDRLKSYARDLKAARDGLEQAVADLKLYAERLEKVILDRDEEIRALKMAAGVRAPVPPKTE